MESETRSLEERTEEETSRDVVARRPARNVAPTERWLSIGVGVATLWAGRRGRGPVAWVSRAVGSALLARGASGRSELYHAFGIDTTRRPPAPELARTVTILASRDAIFDALTDVSKLEELVPRVHNATQAADRWQLTATGLDGDPIELEVQLSRTEDALRWSAPDAARPFEVVAAVRPAPGDRGSELTLRVALDAESALEGAVARRLRKPLEAGLAHVLRRVKARLEAGGVPKVQRLSGARSRAVRARRPARRTA